MEAPQHPDPRRIVVIGPCASGKTSLSTRLQRLGYDAHACGQEHSDIPTLWDHQHPDVVIGLAIELSTLRARRRSETWPDRLYAVQHDRLKSGYARADLILDCDDIDQETVLTSVVDWLDRHPAAAP
jgi:hypothetical protein